MKYLNNSVLNAHEHKLNPKHCLQNISSIVGTLQSTSSEMWKQEIEYSTCLCLPRMHVSLHFASFSSGGNDDQFPTPTWAKKG